MSGLDGNTQWLRLTTVADRQYLLQAYHVPNTLMESCPSGRS